MNAPTGPVNLTEHRGSSGEDRLCSQDEPVRSEPVAQVPRHVAIIMDGNGRWAEQRGLPRLAGHREGVNAIPKVVDALAQRGVQFLTIYAFSTENWARPTPEVEGIIQLLHETLQRETDRFNQKNVRVVHIGNADRLSTEIRDAVERIQDETGANTGLVLNVAFDYGGRQEILAAVKALIREGVSPEAVTEEVFGSRLFTAHSPDPDLIIRTGGELRISNFLLWQSAYSEYFHTPVLWPDLDEAELDRALASYGNRQRRFGNVIPDTGS
ncbi:MAG: polyprenyl diphosphate synthase [Chloroflexota bacterium]|nr:polyprenyl diphosphate synthase [Chloroflexota bacterium]